MLAHASEGELRWFPYEEYGIHEIPTTPYSPDMNAFAERFIRDIRSECLDRFIIFTESQLRNILNEYMYYYNHYRPHQGIKAVPDGKPPDNSSGRIREQSVLFGLHHHYYREVS